MSAGPAPPNPGTPRKGAQAPQPSFLARRPGIIATGLALTVTAYLYLSRPPSPRDGPAISLRTTGVQNIEKAYTNAGATPTHTKAYGGTGVGDKDAVDLKEGGATGGPKHSVSPFDRDHIGDDQKSQTPTKAGEIFDQTMLGSPKGK